MTLQFIHDNNGNTTGVFIPIDDWQLLKTKYVDLQKEEVENVLELADWQKKVIDERLDDYHNNKLTVVNFDNTLDDIEKSV